MFIQTGGHKSKFEKFIDDKKSKEEQYHQLNAKVRADFHLKQLATFENKASHVFKQNFIRERLASLRFQQNLKVNERRNRLRGILAQENAQYEEEIRRLEESPLQIRERMYTRVQNLKQRREDERKKLAQEKYGQRDREGTDEHRKIRSELVELANKRDLEVQMLERQSSQEQQYQEEMIYSEMWKRDELRKKLRENEEMMLRRSLNEDRNKYLNMQKDQRAKQKEDEKLNLEYEKLKLKEQWLLDEQKRKSQEKQRFEFNRKMNQNLFEDNIKMREMKEYQLRLEREADKALLDETVRRGQQLDIVEKEQRERTKLENKQFLQNFRARNNEFAEYDKMIERLAREEQEKQWKKQQDQWNKDQEKRTKLLYSVYDSMENTIKHKKELEKQEGQIKQKDRTTIFEEVIKFEEAERLKRQREWMKNKETQKNILAQIVEKEQKKNRELKENLDRENEELRRSLQLTNKINEERALGRQLIELQKSRVPLIIS